MTACTNDSHLFLQRQDRCDCGEMSDSDAQLLREFDGTKRPFAMEGVLKKTVHGWMWEDMGHVSDVTPLIDHIKKLESSPTQNEIREAVFIPDTENPHWVGDSPAWDVRVAPNILIKSVTRDDIARVVFAETKDKGLTRYVDVVNQGDIEIFAKSQLFTRLSQKGT